jgi:hypothetical protein
VKYAQGNLRQAPRGKLPYIELDGALIADSEHAYNTLLSRGVAQNLDDALDLTPMERAQSLALRALVEEKLIPEHGYER